MQLYQSSTSVGLLSNSHSDPIVPSESVPGGHPVPPATSPVQPVNANPVSVPPVNGGANPAVPKSNSNDPPGELMAIELGERYSYSLSSHIDRNVCIVRTAV